MPQEQPHRDKKEDRKQLRLAKGVPEADPTRFRVLPKERGGVVPHFTRYMDELLSLRSGPAMLELQLFPNAKVAAPEGRAIAHHMASQPSHGIPPFHRIPTLS